MGLCRGPLNVGNVLVGGGEGDAVETGAGLATSNELQANLVVGRQLQRAAGSAGSNAPLVGLGVPLVDNLAVHGDGQPVGAGGLGAVDSLDGILAGLAAPQSADGPGAFVATGTLAA